ncbi:MAG: trypsin-like peptidase domain-containing protein [Pseudomonadota bacterium]
MTILTAVCLAAATQAQNIPQSRTEIQLSFAPLVKTAAPAVVNIFANRVVEQRVSPFSNNPMFADMFRQFGSTRPRIQNSLGSGVILSADGIVVSNYHVVGMATEIRVVLNDRREFSASVLLADEETDLAILKIEGGSRLPWLALRDSDRVEVGELVLAIGNPFGIGQTVSSGIVSGLARSGIATGNARGYFLQTDAPINPGNSGGALIDLNGRLVGVNTSILTRSGGSNGIGFAIPANLVRQFVEQAKAGAARFSRPWAGMQGQAVDGDIARSLGLAVPEGVMISGMHPDSPFTQAGFKTGDVILNVDGQPVNSPAELLFRMSVKPLGQTIAAGFTRDAKILSAQVRLVAAPETPPRQERKINAGVWSDLQLSNINPAVQVERGLSPSVEGVLVTEIPRHLRRTGLRPGDVILAVNGEPTRLIRDVIAQARADIRTWRLDILRDNRRVVLRIRI